MKVGFTASKPAALGWLIVVVVTFVMALKQGPVFDSSLMSLLPKSTQQPLIEAANEQMSERFSQRLILVVSGENEQELRLAITGIAESLELLPEIADVYWRIDKEAVTSIRAQTYPYRFAVLDAGTRRLLLDESYQQIADRALARLYGPLSAGASSLIEDPFGLHLESAGGRSGLLNLTIDNSLLKVSDIDRPAYFLMLTLNGDPFSSGLQLRVLAAITALRSEWPDTIEDISMSGLLVHAAAGARQAKGEISTIGIGSLAGIVVLVLVVFGRCKPLLLMVLPIGIGCGFATALLILIFGKVHLVTFAFGAGLVGVSIDYALHFLCARRVIPAAGVLPKILPGLLLGMFSSVFAYTALALTPFPGLRQMAAFSAFGLCASWLTVVLWFPWLTRSDIQQPLDLAARLDRLRRSFPRLDTSRSRILLLLVPLGLAGIVLWGGQAEDDIRLLQTSPPELLQQEKLLHQKIGLDSSSRFLLVSAETLEQCLQMEEQIIDSLENLRDQGIIANYQALSSGLPSQRRQDANVALVSQLYHHQLDSFYDAIKVSAPMQADALAAFKQSLTLRLSPAIWQQQYGNAIGRELLVMHDDSIAATAIRLTGEFDEVAERRLKVVADSVPGVFYIDQVRNISDLLGKYRVQVGSWVLIAYLAVLLALMIRYGVQVWRILVPPLFASIITLAILLQFETGVNLFHLLALILVLGIGLDMGIFMAETGETATTWLAVSLSACTSLLAFGLLALSATPVLHHFGITVAIGLSLVWLTAPLVRRF